MTVLILDQVTVNIQNKAILKGISFELPPSSVTALLGHNGAGKSTLLKAILGILKIREGTIQLAGNDQITSFLAFKSSISYIPEEPFLLSELTVQQHFQLYIESYQLDPHKTNQRIEHYINTFEIHDKVNQYPEALSKGMRQKVQAICALLPETDLLLIDEPFMGLDVFATDFLIAEIKQKAERGTAILLTTHQLDRLEGLANYYMMLQQGEIIDHGKIENFLELKRRFDQS
ncbi:ABC-2 type transport system ATP-binding protein [Amphibacillus marinus]|uniref:ABC-2 type transport system ATP-binding protein n=1 Tax=Amphibacillus marinus TaxID=872970 RepID=A0A1H8JQ26_9BACI|nr:ABC transporter ATP-binding protein [Amphibacillus marinus]SEN82844.1 ABC-2 type transport system ATP-binding protein [Amphibacillus marinus]